MSAVEMEQLAGARGRLVTHRLSQVQSRIPVLQLLALIAVFLYGSISLPGFSSWSSLRTILVLAALAGLASVGQTVLILMGGFDLSVSGFIVASALVMTTLTQKYNLSFGVALLIAAVACGVLGAIAGQLCHRYRIQPLIVTLAMGTIAVGLIQLQVGALAGGAPLWLTRLVSPIDKTFGLGVPPLIFIWVLVAVVMWVFVHRTVPGRRLLATGANPRAAEYSLIRTRRMWTMCFAFSGIASALAAALIAGSVAAIDPTVGDPYLFQSVVAVIVGGTVFGGPGDYTRSVIGALFLTVLTTVFVGHGADSADEDILYGVILMATMTLYGRQRRVRDRI
ncbi:MAG TPA: ABC transporter permease [Acidimicrobiales bacterium]|nr:ABC transporter permease [Acidimicrobiales bacterium]